MADFAGTPSDDLPAVLAAGDGEVTTVFVSLSARDPEGRDDEYLRWHSLDHRPEQHRLADLRGSLRFVSTPACRAARAASDERYDATDHVMTYLFVDSSACDRFLALGHALASAGRMPMRLPSVEMDAYTVVGKAAAARVVAGADVIPWRPALGVYLLIEDGAADAGSLIDVDGVAGVWWARSGGDESPAAWSRTGGDDVTPRQATYCFLDDDPVAVAERLRPILEQRWADAELTPRLAAPFFAVVPHAWDRYLP